MLATVAAAIVSYAVVQGFVGTETDAAARAGSRPHPVPSASSSEFVAGQIIVGFKDPASAEVVVADHGDSILKGVIPGAFLVAVEPGTERAKTGEYQADPRVEYAHVNHYGTWNG